MCCVQPQPQENGLLLDFVTSDICSHIYDQIVWKILKKIIIIKSLTTRIQINGVISLLLSPRFTNSLENTCNRLTSKVG